MITYRWSEIAAVGIARLVVEGTPLTDVYTKLNFMIVADDGQNAVWSRGFVTLDQPNPLDFTPWDAVTPDQLAGWLEQTLGSQLAVLKQNLAAELAAAQGTTVFAGKTVSAALQS